MEQFHFWLLEICYVFQISKKEKEIIQYEKRAFREEKQNEMLLLLKSSNKWYKSFFSDSIADHNNLIFK